MDNLTKSIAVPVTRKRAAKAGQAPKSGLGQPAARSPAPSNQVPTTGALRHRPGPVAQSPRHRFAIGQRVRMNSGGRTLARSEAACKVMALLPHEGGPLQYRVRSEVENYERVVQEADLDPIG